MQAEMGAQDRSCPRRQCAESSAQARQNVMGKENGPGFRRPVLGPAQCTGKVPFQGVASGPNTTKSLYVTVC